MTLIMNSITDYESTITKNNKSVYNDNDYKKYTTAALAYTLENLI